MIGFARQSLGYSRLVTILKIVLPLSALVMLSLVFLLARTIDPTQAISTASIDVEDRARDPRLSGARFAGVTDDGAALTILTDTARSDPDGALRLDVRGLNMQIEARDGITLNAQAARGNIDRGDGRFSMSGGLSIQVSPGYRLSSTELRGQLDRTEIVAPDAVHGRAPAGQISAGSMRMTAQTQDEGRYLLVFDGGVRLLYTPEN